MDQNTGTADNIAAEEPTNISANANGVVDLSNTTFGTVDEDGNRVGGQFQPGNAAERDRGAVLTAGAEANAAFVAANAAFAKAQNSAYKAENVEMEEKDMFNHELFWPILVLVLLAIVIALVWWCKRKNSSGDEEVESEGKAEDAEEELL